MKEYTAQQVIKNKAKRDLLFSQYDFAISKAVEHGLYDIALYHRNKRDELFNGLQKLVPFH